MNDISGHGQRVHCTKFMRNGKSLRAWGKNSSLITNKKEKFVMRCDGIVRGSWLRKREVKEGTGPTGSRSWPLRTWGSGRGQILWNMLTTTWEVSVMKLIHIQRFNRFRSWNFREIVNENIESLLLFSVSWRLEPFWKKILMRLFHYSLFFLVVIRS